MTRVGLMYENLPGLALGSRQWGINTSVKYRTSSLSSETKTDYQQAPTKSPHCFIAVDGSSQAHKHFVTTVTRKADSKQNDWNGSVSQFSRLLLNADSKGLLLDFNIKMYANVEYMAPGGKNYGRHNNTDTTRTYFLLLNITKYRSCPPLEIPRHISKKSDSRYWLLLRTLLIHHTLYAANRKNSHTWEIIDTGWNRCSTHCHFTLIIFN